MLYNIKFAILNEPDGFLVHLRCGFEGEWRDYGGERESLERDRGTAPRGNASLPTFEGGIQGRAGEWAGERTRGGAGKRDSGGVMGERTSGRTQPCVPTLAGS